MKIGKMVLKKASFSMGCFWEPEDYLSKIGGVVKTRVGYSGGFGLNPTYEDILDHAETVEVIFDDEVVEYRVFLDYFWSRYSPGVSKTGQYRFIIFYHDEEQKRLAENSLKIRIQDDAILFVEILPAGAFFEAEEYHQKYYQKCGKS